MRIFKASLFAATAIATAVGVSAPAFAGGGKSHYSVSVYGGHHGYQGRGYNKRGYYRGGRHHNGRRHYRGRGHGGGKAAAIALGVIGGAIILNEIAEEDRRRDAYRDRYEDRRHRRYDSRRDDYYYERGDERRTELDRNYNDRDYEDRDYDNRRLQNDERRREPRSAPSEPVERDDLDDDLLGGEEGVSFSIQTAYRECSAEARQAASRDGQFIAMPATPTAVKNIGDDMVRITADLTAQDQRGGQFLRTLTCEADARRITYLQLS